MCVYLLICVGECTHGCKKKVASENNTKSSSAGCSNSICHNSETAAGDCCQGYSIIIVYTFVFIFSNLILNVCVNHNCYTALTILYCMGISYAYLVLYVIVKEQ